MEKYFLTSLDFGMKLVELDFINTESDVFLLGNKVFKKLLYSDQLDNKKYTIEYLYSMRNYFDKRFIIPKMLVYSDHFIGYTMDYVNNINFGTILYDDFYSFDAKIKFLKEIGEILDYCKYLRKTKSELSNFYIGDLQEHNFLLNKDTNSLNICDLDSCKVGNNEPFFSKFLSCSKEIRNYPIKYPFVNGIHIPNENSDIYCYIMIIINYLYNGFAENMNKREFYEFLNYLDSLKYFGNKLYSKELLDIFSKVYTNDDNINPSYLLDSICYKAVVKSRKF